MQVDEDAYYWIAALVHGHVNIKLFKVLRICDKCPFHFSCVVCTGVMLCYQLRHITVTPSGIRNQVRIS